MLDCERALATQDGKSSGSESLVGGSRVSESAFDIPGQAPLEIRC